MRNRINTIIVSVLIVILLGIWVERKIIFQEGNPVPIMLAILNLHLTGSNLEKIAADPPKYISRSTDGNKPYIAFMEQNGWKFVEQLGAGLVFAKNGEKLVSTSRMYSRWYMVIKR